MTGEDDEFSICLSKNCTNKIVRLMIFLNISIQIHHLKLIQMGAETDALVKWLSLGWILGQHGR